MAKDLKSKDFHSKWKDADGDSHDHVVSALVVDKDTAGEFNTRTGPADVKAGSVLVETDRPGVYDVHTAQEWKDSDYTEVRSSSASSGSSSGSSGSSSAPSGTL